MLDKWTGERSNTNSIFSAKGSEIGAKKILYRSRLRGCW